MRLEAHGKLHAIFDTRQISARFQKREFVVEMSDNPQYPQYILFQMTGNRCDDLDGFNVGDEIDLQFNLRGREWKSPQGEIKYFNSLDVWTISRANAGQSQRSDDRMPPAPVDDGPPPLSDDDLPF